MYQNIGIISYGSTTPPITGLVANWDAQLGITIGTGVSIWADQSGNGNSLVQASTTRQPAFSGSGTTSMVTFDGVNDSMKAIFTLNQPYTVYAVMKQLTWVGTRYLWDGTVVGQGGMIQHTSTPIITQYSGAFGGDNADLTLNTVKVICAVYNNASSTLSVNDGTKATGTIGTANPSGFTLGSNSSLIGATNIGVQEIAVYNIAHTAPQQTVIITALRLKWGV